MVEMQSLSHFFLFCRSGSTLDEKKAGERKGDPFGHLSDLHRTATPTVRGFVGFSRVKKLVAPLFAKCATWCVTFGNYSTTHLILKISKKRKENLHELQILFQNV